MEVLTLGSLSTIGKIDIDVPFVLKNKILMSPGTWNGYYYSPEIIRQYYENTINSGIDKESSSLFVEHRDLEKAQKFGGTVGGVDTWIGEIKNIRLENDNIVGDVYVADINSIIKLKYGARFGISPKVEALEVDEVNKKILKAGRILNWSLVLNPAIKTTFLNSEGSHPIEILYENMVDIDDRYNYFVDENGNIVRQLKEEVENAVTGRKDMPASDFAWIDPKTGERKLPIHDAAHVRNALARFNQTKGIPPDKKKQVLRKIIARAKKFGIKVSDDVLRKAGLKEGDEMSEETKQPSEDSKKEITMEEIMSEIKKLSETVKKLQEAKAEDTKDEEDESKDKPKEKASGEDEDKTEETKEDVSENSESNKTEKMEMSSSIEELKNKIEELKQKLDEPNRQGVKATNLELSHTPDVDLGMFMHIQKMVGD